MQAPLRAIPMNNDIKRQLEAADGWLDLGLPEEAAAELDAMEAAHRLEPIALLLYTSIYRRQRDWPRLLGVARLLYDGCPKRVEGHLALATATRHLHGPGRALGILMEATELFPDEATVYYDLACCEALSGNPDLARGWLNEAYRLKPELGKAARVDADLAGLRGGL